MANDLNTFDGFVSLGTTAGGRGDLVQLTTPAVNPAISNVSPASGQGIRANDFIQFDLTVADGKGVANTIVWVEYPDKQFTEVVWNGSSFAYNFAGTRTAIANGYRFRWQRLGGYSSSPIIQIQATSVSGGVN